MLVDWLLEVAPSYCLSYETKFLMVDILDRFLGQSDNHKSYLLLAGVACLWIAAKYVERRRPSLRSLVRIADYEFSKQELVHMECVILQRLDYCITFPSPYSFLLGYKPHTTPQMFQLASVVLQQTLKNYGLRCRYRPSLLAAATIYLARNHYVDECYAWPFALAKLSAYSVLHVARVAQSILTARCFSLPTKLDHASNTSSTSDAYNSLHTYLTPLKGLKTR